MKALVLSFDPHLEIANLIVETYNRLWPDCPFVFRIPFTHRDPKRIFAAQNVEFIPTAPDIRSTMKNLLGSLPEDEFVFWCVDDRYPIEIFDLPVLRAVCDLVSQNPPDVHAIKLTDITVDGIHGQRDRKKGRMARRLTSFRRWLKQPRQDHRLFNSRPPPATKEEARNTGWRQREEALPRAPAFLLAGQRFFRQLGQPKNGFYMPQFTTPSFLKLLFFAPALPLLYDIREFHRFLLSTEIEHRSYFPDKFLLSVGESTFSGRLSGQCYEQMVKLGLPPPKMTVLRDYKIYSDRGNPGIYRE